MKLSKRLLQKNSILISLPKTYSVFFLRNINQRTWNMHGYFTMHETDPTPTPSVQDCRKWKWGVWEFFFFFFVFYFCNLPNNCLPLNRKTIFVLLCMKNFIISSLFSFFLFIYCFYCDNCLAPVLTSYGLVVYVNFSVCFLPRYSSPQYRTFVDPTPPHHPTISILQPLSSFHPISQVILQTPLSFLFTSIY